MRVLLVGTALFPAIVSWLYVRELRRGNAHPRSGKGNLATRLRDWIPKKHVCRTIVLGERWTMVKWVWRGREIISRLYIEDEAD